MNPFAVATQGVRDSYELRRIVALPRRVLTHEDATRFAAELTHALALPGRGAALRPWQGVALWEIMQCRGAYLGLPVGQGKTLISYLASLLLGAVRPALCMPAGLRDQTHAAFAAYVRDWHAPNPPPRVMSYEELTSADNVDALEGMRPDLLILDEADCLRNIRDGSAAKRIDRYVRKYAPMVVAMTGTPGRLSILDFAHLVRWSLKGDAPVPDHDAAMWAGALDEKGPRNGPRPGVGALAMLGGGDDIDGARDAFRARLTQTRGVILVDEDSCDQGLTIRTVLAPEDPILDGHFKTFRMAWMTPDGWPLSDPLSVHRHAGELGTGMYLKWDPRPPDWWLEPRSAFCKFVRKVVEDSARSRAPLDTELAVRRAYPDQPEVTAWMAVRDKFTPNSVPVWLSGSVVQYAREWALDPHAPPGLVWCGNVAFGQALAHAAGLTYYGAEGKSITGASITHADHSRPAVLSLAANLRGRNLQGWSRNLMVNPPQSARYLEQAIGRTHRAGQRRAVSVEYLVTSGDIADSFEAAYREAAFGRACTGITQKLLRARVVRCIPTTLTSENEFRWATKRSPES